MLGDSLAVESVDLDAVRARYAEERARRMSGVPRANFVDVEEIAEHAEDHLRDPYAERIERAARSESVDVVVLGAGFSGMLATIELKKRGYDSIRILDKASNFGGTWYWNRYPGAQCDVESYMYLPLLEETGYVPKEKYSYQPEIMEHAQRLGRHYDLYRHALFQTKATDLRWDEKESRWLICTDRGDKLSARYVVVGGGGQDRPKLPAIEGIREFKGEAFHTCRWDYQYSGGDTRGNLVGLRDKKVAVIGTGATGIQCVPYLARDATHVYVLQRTPSVVGERLNRPTDPAWARSLGPGWQRQRIDNYNTLVLGGVVDVDLVDDGWTHAARELNSVYGGKMDGESQVDASEAERRAELADFKYMEKLRGRVDKIVENPSVANALKPWYRYFCKRPTFNDEFLPSFNRANVELIDVSTGKLERITARGFVVAGVEYEVDCLIFATGFDTSSDPASKLGIEVFGRNRKTLREHWAGGARTMFGLMVHNFPNLFMMGSIQVGLTINYTEMAFRQAAAISRILDSEKVREARAVEPSATAEEEYVAEIVAGAKERLAFLAACTPSYMNNEGKPIAHSNGLTDAQYPGGLIEWDAKLQKWLARDELAGLNLT